QTSNGVRRTKTGIFRKLRIILHADNIFLKHLAVPVPVTSLLTQAYTLSSSKTPPTPSLRPLPAPSPTLLRPPLPSQNTHTL
ncbi:hypothetical protein COCMIDRAFT_81484, partial [Bipolaris oryzae ATCC 44560]